jgi:ribosome-interacting GTPase 1
MSSRLCLCFSTLLTTLTGTFSEAASYEFTTLTAIPGTLKYRGAKIQILDLPGIIEGAKDGKGRGRQVISAARTCDMVTIFEGQVVIMLESHLLFLSSFFKVFEPLQFHRLTRAFR